MYHFNFNYEDLVTEMTRQDLHNNVSVVMMPAKEVYLILDRYRESINVLITKDEMEATINKIGQWLKYYPGFHEMIKFHYPEADAPKWVKYSAFKTSMMLKMTKRWVEVIDYDDDDTNYSDVIWFGDQIAVQYHSENLKIDDELDRLISDMNYVHLSKLS